MKTFSQSRGKVIVDAPLRGFDSREVSDLTSLHTGPETLVQQHFAVEQDINTIVRRFGLTSELPAQVSGGMYGDFTGVTDYDSAVARIARADEAFMALPADVRERFGNDPGQLIRLAQALPLEDFNARLASSVVVPPVDPGGDSAPGV